MNDSSDEKHEIEEENLAHDKRFSKLEYEIIKEVVHKYIEIYNMCEEWLARIGFICLHLILKLKVAGKK